METKLCITRLEFCFHFLGTQITFPASLAVREGLCKCVLGNEVLSEVMQPASEAG